ncbi:hypothetical protein BHM03_00027229 [Ensete ventricosum]|nr:hypothetical protein BHM03_00027229 [Ensete ventricosum]
MTTKSDRNLTSNLPLPAPTTGRTARSSAAPRTQTSGNGTPHPFRLPPTGGSPSQPLLRSPSGAAPPPPPRPPTNFLCSTSAAGMLQSLPSWRRLGSGGPQNRGTTRRGSAGRGERAGAMPATARTSVCP